MSILVKYHIFPFQIQLIKNLTMQRSGNTLALASGSHEDKIRLVRCSLQENFSDRSVEEKVVFQELLVKNAQSVAINLISWSPDDKYIAVAWEKVTIWTIVPPETMVQFWQRKDHEMEVTALSWSSDSTRLASGAMERQILVYNVEQKQTLQQLTLESQTLGLIWDTFDKYLAALDSENNVVIWKSINWEKFQTINLNFPSTNQISSKREDRKIDWSPDYRYLLVPSLDDKVVPVVCALDRHQDFQISHTLMGPFSSINCVKFNPNLYRDQEQGVVINIFALGDNDGNISIWGIGQGYEAQKPIYLCKSHSNGQELIEDISWNASGQMMFASTKQKYIIVVLFEEKVFGKQLNETESQEFISGRYGSVQNRALGKNFKLFVSQKDDGVEMEDEKGEIQVIKATGTNQVTGSEEQTQNRLDRMMNENAGVSSNWNDKKTTENNPNTVVITTQQKVIQKDGQQKIIPSMQVIQIVDQVEETQNKEDTPPIPSINEQMVDESQLKKENINNSSLGITPLSIANGNTHSNAIIIESNAVSSSDIHLQSSSTKKNSKKESKQGGEEQQQSNIIPISSKPPEPKAKIVSPNPISEITIQSIGLNRYLEMEAQKRGTGEYITHIRSIINQKVGNQNIKQYLWTSAVQGRIVLVEFLEPQITAFYCDTNLLYFLNENGRRIEPPKFIPNLCYLKGNQNMDLMTITDSGDTKVFNMKEKVLQIEDNIMFLVIENFNMMNLNSVPGNPGRGCQDPIDYVHLDLNGLPVLFFKTKAIFFYSLESKSWNKLDSNIFELGLLQDVKGKENLAVCAVNQPRPLDHFDKFFEQLNPDQAESVHFSKTFDHVHIGQIEEYLYYYMISANNPTKFSQFLFQYIQSLCEVREQNKLRQIIFDTLYNEKAKENQFVKQHNIKSEILWKQFQVIIGEYPDISAIIFEMTQLFNF